MKDLKFEQPTSVEEISQDGNQAKFVIKPLARGYGITLGNALRRVLMSSSMPGSAIVNVEIEGVQHEFSTIEGVYEDVMGIVLNLKEIVIKVDSDDPNYEQKLELLAVGPGEVTAADFDRVTGLEIVNPDKVICNLAENATIHLTVTVRNGVGYSPADVNKRYSYNQTGIIAIDSIYSPVKKVDFHVEKTRGDDDELEIVIETNGAINAKEALGLAAKMLIDYFDIIVGVSEKAAEKDFIYIEEEEASSKILDMKVEQLDLTVRLFNSLRRAGVYTIKDLIELTEEDVMKFRSLGKVSFKELKVKLKEYGLEFKNSSKDDFDDVEEQE